MNRPATSHWVLAVMCILFGSFPVALSLGLIRADPASMQTPRVIVALAGLLFWLGAGALLAGDTRPRLNNLFGGLVLALLATIGGWVSIFGTESAFGGGVPFVSHTSNAWIARVIFGGGAILCAGLSAYAFRRVVRGVA